MTEFFETTIKEALSYGLTSIHDADTKPVHIDFFRKQADAGKLPVRFTARCLMKANPGAAESSLSYGKQRLGGLLGRHATATHQLWKARASQST